MTNTERPTSYKPFFIVAAIIVAAIAGIGIIGFVNIAIRERPTATQQLHNVMNENWKNQEGNKTGQVTLLVAPKSFISGLWPTLKGLGFDSDDYQEMVNQDAGEISTDLYLVDYARYGETGRYGKDIMITFTVK